MFDITERDVSAVYERLKDRYALTLTNTLFTEGTEEYTMHPLPRQKSSD